MLQNCRFGEEKEMNDCRFLESYQIEKPTMDGIEYVTSHRCRLGHEIPLDGCLGDCPDYEPQMPGPHQPPVPRR